jgi:hypothetical protein
MDRRLNAATGRMCNQAYERFARLVFARDAMTAEDQQQAARLFRMLTDLEVRRGTSTEVMLERLPRDFAVALVAAVRRLLDAREQTRMRPRAAP